MNGEETRPGTENAYLERGECRLKWWKLIGDKEEEAGRNAPKNIAISGRKQALNYWETLREKEKERELIWGPSRCPLHRSNIATRTEGERLYLTASNILCFLFLWA